jgi:hypothetical protein
MRLQLLSSHFVDVNDSLTNFLNCQIRVEQHSSELLLASIDQKL